MATLFTRIIQGEIPGTFVWRDDRCVVFLSINPLAPGHALVVPSEEHDHWIDAPPELNATCSRAQVIGQPSSAPSPASVGTWPATRYRTHVHVIPTSS
jgi:histidine triad (HIT) family protein